MRRPKGTTTPELVSWYLERAVEEDGCLVIPWVSLSMGYPHVNHDGRRQRVGRLVLEVHEGPPAGREMLHSCHNRLCIKPEHLRWGTRRENVQDMKRAGRARWQQRMPLKRGRLIPAEVLWIRTLVRNGLKRVDVARLYGITDRQVGAIVNRECWAWL